MLKGSTNANAQGFPSCFPPYTILAPTQQLPPVFQQQQQQYLLQPEFFLPPQPPTNNYILFQPMTQNVSYPYPPMFPRMPAVNATSVPEMPAFQPVPALSFTTTTSSTTNYFTGPSASINGRCFRPLDTCSGTNQNFYLVKTLDQGKGRKQTPNLTLVEKNHKQNLAEKTKEGGHSQQIKQVFQKLKPERNTFFLRRKSTTKMKQNRFTCKHPQCHDVSFNDLYKYRLHDRARHSKIHPYQCTLCLKHFKTQTGAIKHLKTKEKHKINLQELKSYYAVDKFLLEEEKTRLKKADHDPAHGEGSKTGKQNAAGVELPSSSSSSSSSVPAEPTATATTTMTSTSTPTHTTTTTTTRGAHRKKLTTEKEVSKGDNQSCSNCGKLFAYSPVLPPNKEEVKPFQCRFPPLSPSQQPCAYSAAKPDTVREHIMSTHIGKKLPAKGEKWSEKRRETDQNCREAAETVCARSCNVDRVRQSFQQFIPTDEAFSKEMGSPLKIALKLKRIPCICSFSATSQTGEREEEDGKEGSRCRRSDRNPIATRSTDSHNTFQIEEEENNSINSKLFQLKYYYDGNFIEVNFSKPLIDLLDKVIKRNGRSSVESIIWICPIDRCAKLTFARWNEYCFHIRKVHTSFRPYRCAHPGCTEEPAQLKSAIISHFNSSHQFAGVKQKEKEMADNCCVTVEQPAKVDREIRKLKRWWNSDMYQNLVMSRAIKQIIKREEEEEITEF